jgi:hypothetical protein
VINFLGKSERERAQVELFRSAYAVRISGAKQEQWEKFEKESGVVDA